VRGSAGRVGGWIAGKIAAKKVRLEAPAPVVAQRFAESLAEISNQLTRTWSEHYREHLVDGPVQVEPPEPWPDDTFVVFATTTYKRNFQITKMLPLNLRVTWPYRRNVVWAIADFNEDVEGPDTVATLLKTTLRDAVNHGHVCYAHATLPDGVFHCPLAKNTAHAMVQHIARENLFPLDKIFVVNIDNDNIITPRFLQSVAEVAVQQCSCGNAPGRSGEILCQWKNSEPGLTGRIGMPWAVFCLFGGYDQELTGMGYQDVHIMARARLVGTVRYIQDQWVGFSIPNRAEGQHLLESGKHKEQSHGRRERNQG